jgi:hypothetical protein
MEKICKRATESKFPLSAPEMVLFAVQSDELFKDFLFLRSHL